MTQSGADKELVLGNKQLISLFFVVVALCGSFFAMGYMVGKNSGKASLAGDGAASATASVTAPPTADVPRESPAPPSDAGTPAPAEPATASTGTTPAQDSAAVPAHPAPEPSRAETTRPDPKPDHTAGVSVPEAGTSYLQVTALPRADAENVLRTLREQSFPAILAASSKDGLFRVLVGPYQQTSKLADAKARLKTIGFGGAFVQKQ